MKNLSRDTKLAIGILVLLVLVTTFAALQREAAEALTMPKRGLRHRLLFFLFSAKTTLPIALFSRLSHRLRVAAPRLFSALAHDK